LQLNGKYSDEENFYDLGVRAVAALDFLKQRQERVIAVVSHRAFIKVLVGHMLLEKLLTPEILFLFDTRLSLSNVGITKVIFENDQWKLKQWNDDAHLG
jgi:broad specificity phosphatase PhoE